MRQVLLLLLLLWMAPQAYAQSYSVADGRAIKFFQEGEMLLTLKKYPEALLKFQAAIARDEKFVEAYQKATQLLLTQGKFQEAEALALQGKSRLALLNSQYLVDFGWLLTNIYLKQGRFEEAVGEFQTVEQEATLAFKQGGYFLEMQKKIDFVEELLPQKKEIEIHKEEIQKSLEMVKATQKQLILQEKLASLGELTAGIAHEIQNPLNFVNNFSEVNSELIEEMKEELDEIAVPLALGAEMFETDQQAALDEYLNPTDTSTKTETMVTPMGAMMGGDPQYDKLKKAVKLWPNFKTDYKPLVDFAKENNLHFIATNIPRKYATLVYRGGLSALDTLPADKKQLFPTMPMPYDSSLNCYAEIFKATGGHGGQNLPMSQAIKDATMAWKIYGNLPTVPEKYEGGSVFIHYNGSYHSDNHESIEWYINQEEKARWSVSRFAVPPQPTKVITIATRTQANVSKLEKENLDIADFIIVTPDNMTKTH